MPPTLILSSDSHVFEPPDLWTTRMDAAFRDRAPRMQRINGVDQLVVEKHAVEAGDVGEARGVVFEMGPPRSANRR